MKKCIILFAAMFLLVSVNAYADYPGVVWTPNFTMVNVTVQTYELSPAKIAELNNYSQVMFPLATFFRNSSRKYNCHSYAWLIQAPTNIRWLNAPEQYKFWMDGSYTSVSGWPLRLFAKISYRSGIDHSAIVYNASTSNPKVISKWGQGPVMIHPMAHCPYVFGSFVYWQFIR